MNGRISSSGSIGKRGSMRIGVHDSVSLNIVFDVNNPIEEIMDIRQQLFIWFIQRQNNVIIEVDKSDGVMWKSIHEDRK